MAITRQVWILFSEWVDFQRFDSVRSNLHCYLKRQTLVLDGMAFMYGYSIVTLSYRMCFPSNYPASFCQKSHPS